MNPRRTLQLLIPLLLAALLLSARAAADLPAARRALESGHYEAALTQARPYLQSGDPRTATEARLMVATCQVELGRFGPALTTLAPLAAGAAPRPADAEWVALLARAFEGQGLLLEAADWYLTLAALGSAARSQAEAPLGRLLRGRLAQAETSYLLWKYPAHPLLCTATRDYAVREVQRGHPHEAAQAGRLARSLCGEDIRWGESAREGAAQADFFTIGVLAPLNGPYARFGISLAHGADAARRLHNERARFPLKIEIADTEGDPQACLSAVARLYESGVRVFVGEVFSLHTLMVASFLRDRGAVLISPAATDSTVRQLGGGVFTTTVSPHEQMAALALCAAESLGVRRVALFWPGSPAGRRWMNLFRGAMRTAGIAVGRQHEYRPGTTDFSDLIETIGEQLPMTVDAVFCPGEMRELVALLSHCAQTGFLGPYLGGPPMGEEVVARVVAEFGLLALYPAETQVAAEPSEKRAGFTHIYGELFGEQPDDFAHRGWVALGLLGAAIEEGGYCPEALTEILTERAQEPRRRGEGWRLAVPPELAVPQLHLLDGSDRRAMLPLPPRTQ